MGEEDLLEDDDGVVDEIELGMELDAVPEPVLEAGILGLVETADVVVLSEDVVEMVVGVICADVDTFIVLDAVDWEVATAELDTALAVVITLAVDTSLDGLATAAVAISKTDPLINTSGST